MVLNWIDRACPLCGSPREKRVFAESTIDPDGLTEYAFASRKLPEYTHPRLVECQDCSLLYANPVLSPDCLSPLYHEAAFDSHEESEFASFGYKNIVERHLGQMPDRRGAIDIGAGDGTFCERLIELGFSDVVGVEPSSAPIANAKAEIQQLLVHGTFRAEDFAPCSASLVSCFQVMEHLLTPLEVASAAFHILKPKGLFLAVVHNQHAISAKVLGMKSPIYDIEHLQLFTQESGRELLARAGFESIRTYPIWNRYPLQYWMRLFPFPERVKHKLISLAKSSRLGAIPIMVPAGNIVLAGVKP